MRIDEKIVSYIRNHVHARSKEAKERELGKEGERKEMIGCESIFKKLN